MFPSHIINTFKFSIYMGVTSVAPPHNVLLDFSQINHANACQVMVGAYISTWKRPKKLVHVDLGGNRLLCGRMSSQELPLSISF